MSDMRDMLTPEILAGMEKWIDGLEPPRTLPQAVNEILGRLADAAGRIAVR